MELHKLGVADHRAGTQRRRQPIAGRDLRVGGGRPQLTDAAGRQQHGAGADLPDARLIVQNTDAAGLVAGIGEHIDEPGAGQHIELPEHGIDEGAFHLVTGLIPAGVQNPAGVVAALQVQVDGTAGVGIEVGAQPDQPAQRIRGMDDQIAHSVLVAQPGPGDQGVVEVKLGIVIGRPDGGQPALGPIGAGVGDLAARHDRDIESRRKQADHRGQAGSAGAHHHDVAVARP